MTQFYSCSYYKTVASKQLVGDFESISAPHENPINPAGALGRIAGSGFSLM